MLWVKTFHIVFIVTWFAGIFYLPRLFVYHAQAEDDISIERFKVMERKLFYGIMTPGAVFSIVTGLILMSAIGGFEHPGTWLIYKLIAVVLLIGYHIVCWHYMVQFKKESNTHSHVFFRWFNEAPVVLLVVIVALVVFKPM